MSFSNLSKIKPRGYKPLPFPTTAWEEWYAWHPVRIHNKWVWLEHIYRRYTTFFPRQYPIYGTIFDVLESVKENNG